MTLRAPLPLRTTAVWREYRDPAVIPHRYGQTGGALLQYGTGRYQWVWADHPVASIDTVLVDGVEVGNWGWRNAVDNSGHAIALVEFDAPADEGVQLTARGRGKVGSNSGQMIESPADVVFDVLALAGRPVAAAALSAFRRECDAEGLIVAGSIEATDSTLQVVRAICDSVGAMFAPDARELCVLARSAPGGARVASIGPFQIPRIRAELSGIINQLTIQHGWQAGVPQATTVLNAPESIRRYGLRPAVWAAAWLPISARVAFAVGTRRLIDSARPAFVLTCEHVAKRVRVGDTVHVAPPHLPAAFAQLLGVSRDLATGKSEVTLSLPAGAPPRIEIGALGDRIAPEAYAGVAIETSGSSRVLTLLRPNGQPDAGAVAQINGGASIRADGAGRVLVPVSLMPAGAQHIIDVTFSDGQVARSVIAL